MGRPNSLPYSPPVGRTYAKRATPTDGDYDQGGAYWGDLARSPLYAVWGWTEAGDAWTIYRRAPTAALAIEHARIDARALGFTLP